MSLRRIALRDFVLVHEIDLDMTDGFTVLTGETGAGKSILIDALQFVLGARVDALVVREGADRADVSAEFTPAKSLLAWLDEAGFDATDALLLRRTVDRQGKSRGWINGSPATATQLREIGASMVDIHGQHAWQSLTRAEAVRDLLDAYANLDAQSLKPLWLDWRKARERLHQAQAAQHGVQQERERLLWQIGEVDRLAPGDQEWHDLNSTHARLANAQTLIDTCERVLTALDGDETGATAQLGRAVHDLQSQQHIEPAFSVLAGELASVMSQVADVVHGLRNWQRRLDLDPDRLAELDSRLATWVSLARRLRRQPEELPTVLQQWRSALAELDAASDVDRLAVEEQQTRAEYMAAARQLSGQRIDAAPKLAAAVTLAMQGLGMPGGRFEVEVVARQDEPAAHGLDGVAFLVAGHAGSSPRPVGKVASGGELSRIALAIAVTTSQLGSARTLIFDEVDSGVGGAVAETVGRLMKSLGANRQVMTVTHLPQVAACADHHLVVSKRTVNGRTSSAVAAVSGEQRVAEVARMLGGEKLSGTTLAHARELLGP